MLHLYHFDPWNTKMWFSKSQTYLPDIHQLRSTANSTQFILFHAESGVLQKCWITKRYLDVGKLFFWIENLQRLTRSMIYLCPFKFNLSCTSITWSNISSFCIEFGQFLNSIWKDCSKNFSISTVRTVLYYISMAMLFILVNFYMCMILIATFKKG